MTSAEVSSVARCRYCGKEFDVRGFVVFVVGARGAYDSAECALLASAGEPAPKRDLRTVRDVERVKPR